MKASSYREPPSGCLSPSCGEMRTFNERSFHIKGVLRNISSVCGHKVYLLLLTKGRKLNSHYIVPVQFQMSEYVHHMAETLNLGRLYIIFHVSPFLLKLPSTKELILFRTTENTTIQMVSTYEDIEDVKEPLLDLEQIRGRLLTYSKRPTLSYFQGVVASIISEECGIYLLSSENVTLVTSPLSCCADVPKLAAGDRIEIFNCHKLESLKKMYLVLCGASRLRLIDKHEMICHRSSVLQWMKSLNCTTLHFAKWLHATLLGLTERFVPMYISHVDLVSYEKDSDGKRTRSLLFTLLRLNALWLRSRPMCVFLLEFLSQPHQCTTLEEEERRLLSLEWPSLKTVAKVVKYQGIPFVVAPTWRMAIVPVADLPWQVIGCLGISKEGALHLCDSTNQIRIRTSVPIRSLPLGHIVIVPKEGRFILEAVSTMKGCISETRHILFYLECHSFLPILRTHNHVCPHGLLPMPKAGRCWQTFQVEGVTLPRTVGGKHLFEVSCMFSQQTEPRILVFSGLLWLPYLQGGEVFRAQLYSNTKMTFSRTAVSEDTALQLEPHKDSFVAAATFPIGTTYSTNQALICVYGVLIDKFYQDARRLAAREGAHQGPNKWSPCLKVMNFITGTPLLVYLNTLTAEVPLLGLLPGALLRLDFVRLSMSASMTQYASSTHSTVMKIFSQKTAVHNYLTSSDNLWPAALHPCNGLGYNTPMQHIECFLTKILSLRIWPDCDKCTLSIREHGESCTHKPIPTVLLRFEAIWDADVITAVCWGKQAKQVLQLNDKLWNTLMDYAAEYKECVEYSYRGVRDMIDQSGREMTTTEWTPLELMVARCCKHRSFSGYIAFMAREMRFAASFKKNVKQEGQEEFRGSLKKRFHVVHVEKLVLGAIRRLRQAAVKEEQSPSLL